MDNPNFVYRFLLNQADAQARQRVNQPIYRIGNKDSVTGLYETLGLDGSVIGYGQKIFNNDYEYGDVVRATKPYGASVWALDKIDSVAKLESEQPDEPSDPDNPPDDPPPSDPPANPPSNGFPTTPPSSDPPSFPSGTTPKQPDPPVNCAPPPPGCRWQDSSIPCNGNIQDFDYAILNTGTLILCCDKSVTPPDSGCTPFGYSCVNGVCVPTRGSGQTLAQCQAGLIQSPLRGGQCKGRSYLISGSFTLSWEPGFPTGATNPFSFVTNGSVSFTLGQIGLLSSESGQNAIIGSSNGVVVQTYQGVSTSATRFADAAVYTATFTATATPVDGLPDSCGDPPPSCGI